MMTGRMIICCLLFALNAAGQEQNSADSVRPKDNDKTFMGRIHKLQSILDKKARAKVDSHYIEVPAKPWKIVLRYNANMVDLDYDNHIDHPGVNNEYSEWQMCIKPPMASSIGFWAGYRGTGISYSKSLTKNAGRYFSVSSTGAKYGLNFRLRRFSTTDISLKVTDYENGVAIDEYKGDLSINAPVWVRSVYINGYYVFNGRRYSQAAAYNQSVIQRRSAGSLIAGATWYQSSFDYKENLAFMLLSNDIGLIKVNQANLGVGYGYNFVPFRGFIINAMAMATVSVYNRVKVEKYDSNFDLSAAEETDDYGTYNPKTRKWENGKEDKSIFMYKAGDQAYFWENGSETEYSMLRFNFDLRLGIAYNWKNYFIGVQAQFNNFSYKKDQNKVSIKDAYAKASLGIRL